MSKTTRSRALFARACKTIPGGVNSPVRAFRSVGGEPRFIARGARSRIVDEDGVSYIDYVGSWGPLVLGHAPAAVRSAVARQLARGWSFGAPTEGEVRLAEMICQALRSVEKVRLVNSGTEATMSALRLARAFTGRSRILKFDGCYHGHVDSLLVQAGSGVATLGLPDSPGVPPEWIAHTVSVPFNDLAAVERALDRYRAEVAAIIVEPVAGNMGVVAPARGFLRGLRKLTREHGTLLIFDEVMTGFRVAWGGAQRLYGIEPDLTCLGKIIGGGLPVGAYGGASEIMRLVAPEGPVYQAGTLSGNPLAVASGLATLQALGRAGVYRQLEKISGSLAEGLAAAASRAGVPVTINRVGSMLTCFFTTSKVVDFASAKTSDRERYGRFFHALLERGVYFPPSQFEALFVSTAHSARDVEATLRAARRAFEAVA